MRFAFTKGRRHRGDPDAFWWHHKEIEKEFGRGEFDAINELLRLFEVSGNYSAVKGETRRYRLTPDAERIYLDTLKTRRRGNLGSLVDGKGRNVNALPAAVAAKDVAGNTAKVWSDEPVPRLVPVQIEALDGLAAMIAADTRDLFIQATPSFLEARGIAAAEIRKWATTRPAGRGFVPHRYQETSTGRLSAIGINLQSAPRTVRKAALAGLWDYDFENCHYAIVEQMAARYGRDCPAIRHYLENKATVRKGIAAEIGAAVDQVKRALIAVVYGARASASRKVALYEAMGDDMPRTRALLQHPLFTTLHREVKAARDAILAGWPVTRRRLINEAGKGVAVDAKREQRMAHLVQGAEAVILRAALRQCPDKVVLLLHDGFVTTEPVDTDAIEDVVLRETGYRMRLAGERIVMPPDLDA